MPEKITTDQLKEKLEQDKVNRIELTKQEINAILQKNKCAISPVTIVKGGQIIQKLEFVAL